MRTRAGAGATAFVVDAVAAAAFALAAAPAAQADPIRIERSTTVGREVLIRGFAEFDSHCRLVRAQTITVVEAPAHGKVETRPGEVVIGPNWVGPASCTGTRLSGVHVYYVPEPGYEGPDHLSLDVGYVRFPTVRAEVAIRVRSARN